MTAADRLAFVTRVLRVFARHDQRDDLFWSADDTAFAVVCNDVFHWGTSDLEEITPANVGELERAYADAKAAHEIGEYYGGMLFAARVRGMRPQNAAYPADRPGLWPLLDACGPPRAVGPGNPRPHPGDRP